MLVIGCLEACRKDRLCTEAGPITSLFNVIFCLNVFHKIGIKKESFKNRHQSQDISIDIGTDTSSYVLSLNIQQQYPSMSELRMKMSRMKIYTYVYMQMYMFSVFSLSGRKRKWCPYYKHCCRIKPMTAWSCCAALYSENYVK